MTATNLTSSRRAHDTPTRSETAQDELAIGTTARPAVQIGRTRAPLTRVSWDARRTPAPSSPGSIHASDARRSHARAATTHAAARARPDVATVGGLHPRRLAAATAPRGRKVGARVPVRCDDVEGKPELAHILCRFEAELTPRLGNIISLAPAVCKAGRRVH